MFDNLMEKDAKSILEVPGMMVSGYISLICGGVFVYGFSIANIYYIDGSDLFKLLAQLFLWSYFMIGIISLHVCVRFFNRLIMMATIGGIILLWTVLTASLYALQSSAEYPLIQILYGIIVIFQLVSLLLVGTKWITSPTLRKKIFRLYLGFTVLFFAFNTIPPLLNGDGRWSGPDHVGWYEKQFGLELGEVLRAAFLADMMIAILVAIIMWMITRVVRRFKFNDINSKASDVLGYLFYMQGRWGYSGVWGYLEKGVRDFPDAVTFLDEKEGVFHFKKKGTTTRKEEELILSKNNSLGNGIFSCEFIGDERRIEKVMVLYEERHGRWRPYEFEEQEEKSSS
ncbi:hypothetical protein P4637_20720 [Halalkalibacterium halodurans]|uniref:hypothetical protein n=1 Tax=Halalkalibacterium halodurans TaxID=86665 RepID=UPI002E1A28C7|nr:hypothetical protein [Halalkalibacterium halodurans]MED4087237.1 hypothetical protein [Halalkalibacterium halodurans]MED4106947.1 hypothetical protein [Halalkalibacterium halodurans]MED4111015.1 hypothetical protein [Halalkalibacterium halodurans]MED4125642.1 hypothetical protein [Halalkalibacterium halodurans]